MEQTPLGVAHTEPKSPKIVALARRLAIGLWRYLEHGEIPAGAVLKPVTA